MNTKILRTLLISTLCFAPVAQAVPIQFSIDGIVDFAADGNIFGLEVDDTVTATAIFDSSFFTGSGEEEISFGDGSGNTMTHVIGDVTFTESMDIDFLGGFFPVLVFDDGTFAAWSFIVELGTNGGPANYAGFDDGFEAAGLEVVEVSGIWDLNTAELTVTTVPEPTTLLLLALGLLTLGLQRRAGR